MNNIMFFKRFLYEDIKFFLLNDKLVFLSNLGKIYVCLKSCIFVKNITFFEIILLFVNKNIFNIFLKMFSKKYIYFNKFFFFQLRLKGLGYRMKRFKNKYIRFFFTKNQLFYLHIPVEIYIKMRRRNIYILSINKSKLNDIFHHFMLLRKLDLYEKTKSFVMKNKILFLKKRK
jgi:hypothetical protein